MNRNDRYSVLLSRFYRTFPQAIMLRGYSQSTCSKEKNAFTVCLSPVYANNRWWLMLASRASFRTSSAMDDEHCVLVHSTYTECQSALYTADWISNSRGKYCLGPIAPGILNTSGRIIRNAKCHPGHVKRTRSFGIEMSCGELCSSDTSTCIFSNTYSDK